MKLYIPSREKIDNLKVGDKMLNCFGKWAEVAHIINKGERIRDRAYFALVTLKFNSGSTISHSYVEDELIRTVEMSDHFTSWETDRIEQLMLERDIWSFEAPASGIKDEFLSDINSLPF